VLHFFFGNLHGVLRIPAPVQFDVQKLEKELIALKEIVLTKEKAQMEDYAGTTDNSTGLEFFEDLKQPQKPEILQPPISENDITRQTGEQNTKQKTSLAKKTKKEYELLLRAEKSAPEAIPRAAAERTPPKETKTEEIQSDQTESSEYRYTIQVSSLKDPKAAAKTVEALKQKGYAAYRITAHVAEKGTWYRVRVGPFRDKDSAQKQLSRLKNDQYNAILISL